MTTPPQSPQSVNPWPYAIMAWFAFAITVAIVFVVFILRQEFDLVRPDYYEAELKHQNQIDRVQRTAAMASEAAVEFDPEAAVIRLRIPAIHANAVSGEVHLYRPSSADMDVRVPLEPDATGALQLDSSRLAPGLWKVRLQWDAGGKGYFFERAVVIPAPGVP